MKNTQKLKFLIKTTSEVTKSRQHNEKQATAKALTDFIGVVYLNCLEAEFPETLIIHPWVVSIILATRPQAATAESLKTAGLHTEHSSIYSCF